MMRVNAIVLAQDERRMLKGLGALGAVHLTRTRSGPDTALLAPTDYTGELTRYDRIRNRIQALRQSLEIIPSPNGQRERGEEGLTQAPLPVMTPGEAETTLFSMEQRSAGLLEDRQNLVQRQKELAVMYERVSCYRGFDIPLTGSDEYSFLHFVTEP